MRGHERRLGAEFAEWNSRDLLANNKHGGLYFRLQAPFIDKDHGLKVFLRPWIDAQIRQLPFGRHFPSEDVNTASRTRHSSLQVDLISKNQQGTVMYIIENLSYVLMFKEREERVTHIQWI